jgi:hypothetical protein
MNDEKKSSGEAQAESLPLFLKEMFFEYVEPIKNYGFLFFITAWGIIVNPKAVVESISDPLYPASAKYAVHNIGFIPWLISSWSLKRKLLLNWFAINSKRLFYKPRPYLGLCFGLAAGVVFAFNVYKAHHPGKFPPRPSAAAAFSEKMSERFRDMKAHGQEPTEGDKAAFENMHRLLVYVDKAVQSDTIKGISALIVLTSCCFIFSLGIFKFYDIHQKKLINLGLYYLSLVILIWIPCQLLTDMPAGSFTRSGNILFAIDFIILPNYLYTRYITKENTSRKPVGTFIKLSLFYTLVFFTVAAIWIFVNPYVIEFLDPTQPPKI